VTDYPVPGTMDLETALSAPFLPGHAAGEQMIVKAWLADQGSTYQRFGFNVRIGQGADIAIDAPDSTRRFLRATTRKRIDVVAFRGSAVTLLEVKIQANLGALGQMLGYRHLWSLEHPAWPVEAYGIICHIIALDTATVYTAHGMPFYLYPDVVLPPLVTVPPPG